MDEETRQYYERLKAEADRAYAIAQKARVKHLDPSDEVEIKIAENVAGRVEGLLGIKGIKQRIEELEKEGLDRVEMAFKIVEEVARGQLVRGDVNERIEMAVRIGTAILTEGVLVAPTEGISRVRIEEFRGQKYVAIYYAGPIRSAGGTTAALTVLLADVARRTLDIPAFEITDEEEERVVEEIQIYHSRVSRLQYYPHNENHIREVLKRSPVCIDGDPTEKEEVSAHRDAPRVSTNRIRGGVALVVCEGLLQKAAKVHKFAKRFNLDEWLFIKELAPVKGGKSKADVYLDGLVAGRPVIAHPSQKGGFRLRYGRTFTTGIMSKAIHPATMEITSGFLAYGTQMKVEKPGKGMVVVSSEDIEGPIVGLKDGSVKQLKTRQQAIELKSEIEEIIHLGDILVSYGDFLKSNTELMYPGYVEEIWEAEMKKKGLWEKLGNHPKDVKEAFAWARNENIALHPSALLYWDELSPEELIELHTFLNAKAKKLAVEKENGESVPAYALEAEKDSKEKRMLELLGIEHDYKDGKAILEEKWWTILHETLEKYELEKLKALVEEAKQKSINELDKEHAYIYNESKTLWVLRRLSSLDLRDKGGTYIGARMGRPEKAKMREIEGSVNVLFPTGTTTRGLTDLYNKMKERKRRQLNIEAMAYKCPKCQRVLPFSVCPFCNVETVALKPKTISLDFIELYDKMKERLGGTNGSNGSAVIGVKGLISDEKIPERLEKGFLRAKYGLMVFKDGTIRFDATDVPLTHFYVKDIGTSVEKLRELGYTKDVYGEELRSEEQIVELFPQDIIVSEFITKDLVNTAKFVDEMLVKLYGMEPYYNVETKEDLVGKLVIGLSPHTSAGNVARIIGFTKAKVGYGHPYFHTAKRRNTDGDEDSIMLLLDALINFSKRYLGTGRGGTMDTPLVLNVIINPKEVDDEVHVMEVVDSYNWDFYEAAYRGESPGKVKVKLVIDMIKEGNPYRGIKFSHAGARLHDGPLQSRYTTLKSMEEKAEVELEVMKKIRAVDEKDAILRVIQSHFIPDIYGNLRKYGRQQFRCTRCNEKYRRIPLTGRCVKCGGNLTLTIHKGGIEKYLKLTERLIQQFGLSKYLKQRIDLVRKEIDSVFGKEDTVKQNSLEDFFTA